MSAIDETWGVHPEDCAAIVLESTGQIVIYDVLAKSTARDRFRIAACAPEALRMLMFLERIIGADGESVMCGCVARDEVNHGWFHESDCEWLALMRKAGLR